MIRQAQHGFTIIEVLLVVSISGALITTLLIGAGGAINQQRYKDSVNTLKSYIQTQYDQVANTSNERTGTEGCYAAATVTTAGPQTPGTSDCVLVGRYITIGANGKDLSVTSVLAYRAPGVVPVSGASDITDLSTYKLGTIAASKQTDSLAWNASVVKKGTTTPQGFSMFIVRAPLSGSIMTFTSDSVIGDINTLVTTPGASTTTRNLCINPANPTLSARLAVQVPAGAANQGAIQIPLVSSNVCD